MVTVVKLPWQQSSGDRLSWQQSLGDHGQLIICQSWVRGKTAAFHTLGSYWAVEKLTKSSHILIVQQFVQKGTALAICILLHLIARIITDKTTDIRSSDTDKNIILGDLYLMHVKILFCIEAWWSINAQTVYYHNYCITTQHKGPLACQRPR